MEYAKAELEKLASSQTSEEKFREEIHQREEKGLLQFNMKDCVYTDMTKLKKYIASLVTHIDERFRESVEPSPHEGIGGVPSTFHPAVDDICCGGDTAIPVNSQVQE